MDRSGLAGGRREAECREGVLGAGGGEPTESRAGRPRTTRPRGPYPAIGGIQARLWLLVGAAHLPGGASVCVGTGAVDGARPELVEPRLRIPFTFRSREGPGSLREAWALSQPRCGKDPSRSLHFFHHCRPRAGADFTTVDRERGPD